MLGNFQSKNAWGIPVTTSEPFTLNFKVWNIKIFGNYAFPLPWTYRELWMKMKKQNSAWKVKFLRQNQETMPKFLFVWAINLGNINECSWTAEISQACIKIMQEINSNSYWFSKNETVKLQLAKRFLRLVIRVTYRSYFLNEEKLLSSYIH